MGTRSPLRVLLLFLDGVGLGPADPEVNPLAARPLSTLRGLLDGATLTAETPTAASRWASLVATDATLGVPGLPQSATGQATLLTGRNVPALIGEHYGPRPDGRIRPLLERDTLFHRALAAGRRVAFANAYPARYFVAVGRGKRLPGALAYAARAAGVRLRTAEDLARGLAISVDFTNVAWRTDLGYPDMPLRTPEESGHVVARLLAVYDWVVIDQWVPDMLGHRRDMPGSVRFLGLLDRFLRGVLERVDLEQALIIITSDHGNFEDLRTRHHTTNPVPTVLIGRGHRAWAQAVRRLDDVAQVIAQALALPGAFAGSG